MSENHPGKFIVIDGTDGSGKATQTELLAQRLKRFGLEVETADFPQYNTKSAGLVEEYLSGKYGSAEAVGPYRSSIFYACDRFDASFLIKKWLAQGKIVISNRYVTANMGHQGAKIKNALERKVFFNWLYELEYEIFEIPEPDLNIILRVRAEIAQTLAKQRRREDWAGKQRDLHEENLSHLKNAETAYQEIARSFPNMFLIDCVQNNKLLARETINELIWQRIKKLVWPSPLPSNKNEINKNKFMKIHSADYYSLVPGERALIKNDLGMAASIINVSHDLLHITPGQDITPLLKKQSDEADNQLNGSGLF